MAKFDELKNAVIFDDNDLSEAWEHAPKLINKPAAEMRLCYICKFHMDYKIFVKGKNINNSLAWTIDMINAKKFNLEPTNLIAIHLACVGHQPKKDNTKILKKISAVEWQFDDAFWNHNKN
ncbi:hypothetical protein [Williamsoniiplasma lucivorax]|uniref:Uncharacterized protein n=1 Tax=Williamsoniiplasma lucivorax TaxID=209274 RepID=A0A2S5REL8_9MOLU|nr:hypothetical protein [Williamsoniiplasma lucivorax]PPE05763.1 hypothetical protein ELUCI_v1c00510 [Williamsoniiplasma lucivorax]